MKRTLAVGTISLGTLSLLASGAHASSFDISNLQNTTQSQFHDLSEDLGAALSYKAMAPAESLGPLGFDIGIAVTGTTLANTASVQKAIGNSTVFSTLPVPTIRAIKGLPYNVDVGAMYAKVPSSGISLYGGEVKWAFIPGDIAVPAVAARLAITRLDGVSQMGFETYSGELSISKGFVVATPYGGIGVVRSTSSTNGLPLQQVNLTQGKVFVGAGFNFGLLNLDVEADTTGSIRSYGIKGGLRF